MAEPMKKTSCQIASWGMGAGAGFVAFLLLIFMGEWSFLQAVFGAGVIFFVVGAFLAFVLCRPLPPLGEIQAGMNEMADPATPAQRSAAAPATTPAPAAAPSATPASAPSAQAAAAAAPAAITPAAEAEAKAETASQTAPETAPVAVSPAAPKPAAVPAEEAGADATVGTKPASLSAARGGQPDDLKQIKGVGPKMETMLHGMGFFHFDQVAAWTPAELAWVDENLTGFKGRATRDNWVAQAKALARGAQPDV